MNKEMKERMEFIKDVLKMAKVVGLENEYKKSLENLEECKIKSDVLYAKYKKVSFEESKIVLKELDIANNKWKRAMDDKYLLEGIIIEKYFRDDENRKIG